MRDAMRPKVVWVDGDWQAVKPRPQKQSRALSWWNALRHGKQLFLVFKWGEWPRLTWAKNAKCCHQRFRDEQKRRWNRWRCVPVFGPLGIEPSRQLATRR